MSAPRAREGALRSSRNPFIVGNPVRDRTMFFGRETEFDLVRRRFRARRARGGLIVFCGERRSGKTSILFQILDGRLGPDFLPVLIDMQSMAIENEVDFLEPDRRGDPRPAWGRGAGPPAAGLRLRPPSPAAAFQRFIGELAPPLARDRTPILLFDEYELFENKIESGILSEDILNVLASLMESHGVCLVFTGSQHLEQRKQPLLADPGQVDLPGHQLPEPPGRRQPHGPPGRGPGAVRPRGAGRDLPPDGRAALLHAGDLPEPGGPPERDPDHPRGSAGDPAGRARHRGQSVPADDLPLGQPRAGREDRARPAGRAPARRERHRSRPPISCAPSTPGAMPSI